MVMSEKHTGVEQLGAGADAPDHRAANVTLPGDLGANEKLRDLIKISAPAPSSGGAAQPPAGAPPLPDFPEPQMSALPGVPTSVFGGGPPVDPATVARMRRRQHVARIALSPSAPPAVRKVLEVVANRMGS